MTELETYGSPSNGAAEDISFEQPYVAHAVLEGVAPFLFHAWNCEAVEEKAIAKKGSAAKKSDNLESYVYRTPDGELAIPSEYFRQSIIGAARFRQDPRSPRKSAMDLYKAGLAGLNELCATGVSNWDYLDRRRVAVQRSGITRERPALRPGWRVAVDISVLVPEYIAPAVLHEVLNQAGRLIGVGDFRPSFGRFRVVEFETLPSW